MTVDFMFVFNSILMGVGLAMDAFSVSLANGLNEPKMKTGRMSVIAAVFAGFQFAMPMLGWICVSTIANRFEAFQTYIPWIALILLSYIGGKMLYDGIKCKDECPECTEVGLVALLVQGIATSIDALSVGFTISEHTLYEALVCCALIAVTTFIICMCGLTIGKKAGTKLAGKAGILGGVILIFIGIEIFVTSICS